jgi:hypothetical protein
LSKRWDPTNISQFAKNLLASMRDGVPLFSVIDFVWKEIKGISMNPQKTCGFTPYLMFIIEDVIGRNFPNMTSTGLLGLIPPRSFLYL